MGWTLRIETGVLRARVRVREAVVEEKADGHRRAVMRRRALSTFHFASFFCSFEKERRRKFCALNFHFVVSNVRTFAFSSSSVIKTHPRAPRRAEEKEE